LKVFLLYILKIIETIQDPNLKDKWNKS